MTNSLLGLRILIVDDIREHCEKLKKMLAHLEYELIAVTDTREAIALVQKKENIFNPFDVAIIDFYMPSMDGITLGLKLKELDSRIEIIILSADSSKEAAREILSSKLNIAGLVCKNEEITILSSILNYILTNKDLDLSQEKSIIKDRTRKYFNLSTDKE